MPPLESMDRYQDAVLWPARGEDQTGETLVGDPEPVKVRWHWTRRQMNGPDGKPVSVDAVAVVDRQIDAGSLMWPGRLDDLPPGTDFTGETSEALEVVAFEDAIDLKGRPLHTYREVGLARYKDAIAEEAED